MMGFGNKIDEDKERDRIFVCMHSMFLNDITLI